MASLATFQYMWATMFRHSRSIDADDGGSGRAILRRTSTFRPSDPAKRALGWPWSCPTRAGSCSRNRRSISSLRRWIRRLQGILAKAPVHATPDIMRNAQLIKARVIWSTKPMVVVPVLAVTRQGGQSFVFVARKQPERASYCSTNAGHAGRHGGEHLLHYVRA